MARRTKEQLISDLELRLTTGSPSVDLEIEQSQINHWLDVAANMLLSDYLSRQLMKGEDINPEYILSSAYLSPASETLADVPDTVERYYIDISSLSLLPFRGKNRDYSIIRVTDKNNRHCVDIDYNDSDYVRNLSFSNANKTKRRFLWYREGTNIFIDGIDSSNAASEKFRVHYIASIDTMALSGTSEYPLSEDLIAPMIEIAEEIGREELSRGIYDVVNDGIQV